MTTTQPRLSGDLREQVAELLARTRTALASDERASSLVARLPVMDDAPLRVAVAGPHNAGKSMLIAALLELPRDQVEAMTGAVPLTEVVTPYEWLGCTLLDLPGTLSGLDAHDAVAAAGVRGADLLLLVTSVELPGEAETEQIRDLLGAEGFGRRALVVLNKCNSEDNDLELVLAEMLDRLAPFPWIKPLFADARDHVAARIEEGLTDEDRELLRADSGIDELANTLAVLAVEQGPTARLQAMCQEVRRLSVEASQRWTPSSDEEAQETIAQRIRAAFDAAREELDSATDVALETLDQQIAGAGKRLASAVSEEDASVSDQNLAAANQDEASAAKQYGAAVTNAVEGALVRLDTQLGTTIAEWDRYSPDLAFAAPEVDPGRARKKPRVFVDDAASTVWTAAKAKLREEFDLFVNGGVRKGSKAHDLAMRLKAAMGGDPAKPYEHIHRAENLTEAGRRAGKAAEFVGPLLDAKGIWDDVQRGRAVKKRRAEIRSHYAQRATETVAQERAAVQAYVEARFADRRNAVAGMLDSVDQSSRVRTDAQARWRDHEKQARALAVLVDEVLTQ